MRGLLNPPIPLDPDDVVRFTLYASTTATITCSALVSRRLDEPPRQHVLDPFSHSTGDRTRETFDRPIGGGFLWGAGCAASGAVVSRGQAWVAITLGRHGRTYRLAQGYTYEGHGVTDGELTESLDGRGYLRWLAVATNEDGDNDTTLALAIANGRRKVRELLLYYTCSTDVANRTMILVFQKGGLAQPTGYGSGAVDYQWQSPTLTLTASEDGQLVVGPSIMFQSQNDDGSIAYSNNSTVPHPLPRWVEENDLVELFVNISAGETADKYSCYALVEDWIEP